MIGNTEINYPIIWTILYIKIPECPISIALLSTNNLTTQNEYYLSSLLAFETVDYFKCINGDTSSKPLINVSVFTNY